MAQMFLNDPFRGETRIEAGIRISATALASSGSDTTTPAMCPSLS